MRFLNKIYIPDKIKCLMVAFALAFAVSGCGNNTSVDNTVTEEKTNVVETIQITEQKTNVQATEKEDNTTKAETKTEATESTIDSSNIPEYSGEPYVVINNNNPNFKKKEITDKSFETYSSLDALGRCGVAIASVGKDIMPTEKRGAIGQVKPTGWHTVKYDSVDGKYLYNRCHLIGYQLTGENANEKNLITGTRYLNVDGMLPFEDMVADYVKETGNHVMYRVTPIYKGRNLLASGVEMEGYSVEDKGEGIKFHVYCYNVQPDITIDYATGESSQNGKVAEKNTQSNSETNNSTKKSSDTQQSASKEYVLNLNTHKFHLASCRSVKTMSNANKGTYTGNRADLIEQGYEPCKICNP
jgi:DNA-entry nuclease